MRSTPPRTIRAGGPTSSITNASRRKILAGSVPKASARCKDCCPIHCYTTTITRSEAPHDLAYDADGDLVGRGRFELRQIADSPLAGGTEVLIYWNVATRGHWLNRLAPLLKWLFAANHNYVMRRGQRGLAKWLENDPYA
jgi:hypothetical protein